MGRILGKFLAEKRLEQGMTQQQVADKLDYSTVQFISNFERGLCQPPLHSLRILIDLYKMNPRKILELILQEEEEYLKEILFKSGKKVKRRK